MKVLVPAVSCLIVCACADTSSSLRSDRESRRVDRIPVHNEVETRIGTMVAKNVMQDVLTRITRQVALAMDDDAIRSAVYEALQASSHREGKLHWRKLLTEGGTGLLEKVAAVGGTSDEGALAALDSIVDLEFYMPVPEHRDTWDGSRDLIVVGSIDDSETPIGFDLRGNLVSGLSAYNAPSLPTLVLVESETNFDAITPMRSCFDSPEDCHDGGGGGGGGGGNPYECMSVEDCDVRLISMMLEDDKEPWTRGEPEIVFKTVKAPFGNITEDDSTTLGCMCEAYPECVAPYSQNIDDVEGQTWYETQVVGRAPAIVPLADLAQGTDQFVTLIAVYENDGGPFCEFKPDNAYQSEHDFYVQAELAEGVEWPPVSQQAGVALKLATLAGVLTIVYTLQSAGDDFIGLITLPPGVYEFSEPRDITLFRVAGDPIYNGWARFELQEP